MFPFHQFQKTVRGEAGQLFPYEPQPEGEAVRGLPEQLQHLIRKQGGEMPQEEPLFFFVLVMKVECRQHFFHQ